MNNRALPGLYHAGFFEWAAWYRRTQKHDVIKVSKYIFRLNFGGAVERGDIIHVDTPDGKLVVLVP